MTNHKSKITDRGIQLLALAGVLIILGGTAWGIGWAAHGLLVNHDPVPSPLAMSTMLPSPAPTNVPSAIPTTTVTAPLPTPTPIPTSVPTSTPVSTASLPSTSQTYTVKKGEGLAKIAGKVCPDLVSWPERDAFGDEIYERNTVKIKDKEVIIEGVELIIPDCP